MRLRMNISYIYIIGLSAIDMTGLLESGRYVILPVRIDTAYGRFLQKRTVVAVATTVLFCSDYNVTLICMCV